MKLLVDGVEIPWPKKIEVQVDEAGETVGPLYVEFYGGQLLAMVREQEQLIAGLQRDRGHAWMQAEGHCHKIKALERERDHFRNQIRDVAIEEYGMSPEDVDIMLNQGAEEARDG